MSWLAKKLDRRIEIRSVERAPATNGGFEQRYKTLAAVWASIKPISTQAAYFRYAFVRDKQIGESVTHTFTVRCEPKIGVVAYGASSILKAGNYIAMPVGKSDSRLFKIHSVIDPDEKGVMLRIDVEETSYQSEDSKIAL